jgi:hypothetical protein
MSTFGKILAFLNILGTLSLVLLGLMVYAKRQAWSHAVFLHQIEVDGLPVTDQQTDDQGNLLVDRFSEDTRQKLFSGPAVKTQVEEVQRVYTDYKSKVQSGQPPERIDSLARLLLPFATNNTERERRVALIRLHNFFADPKTTFDPLGPPFQEAFEKAWTDPAVQGARTFETFAKRFHDHLLVIAKNWPANEAITRDHLEDLRYDRRDSVLAQSFLENLKAQEFDNLFQNAGATPEQRSNLFRQVWAQTLEGLPAAQQKDLEEKLDLAFKGAREGIGEDGKPLSVNERRQEVARVLFNVLTSPPPKAASPAAGQPNNGQQPAGPLEGPAYKRYLTVVGLEMAGPVIQERAFQVEDMAKDLALSLAREREGFEITHKQLIEDLLRRASELAAQQEELRRLTTRLLDQQKVVKANQEQNKAFEDALQAARTASLAKLNQLQKMSNALLQVRIQVRDALKRNQEYEKQLRTLEGVQ